MEEELIFKGIRFNLLQKGHYQWVDHPGAVVILPLLEPDKVVMIRNTRIAVHDELWELPAGTLEPDEAPINTASRELEEETGFRAQKITPFPLPSFYPSPGINNELMYPYIATDLKAGPQKLDHGEQIRVEILPFSEILSMIKDGLIRDSKTLVTLLYYATFLKNAPDFS